jgi:hypothetical protein
VLTRCTLVRWTAVRERTTVVAPEGWTCAPVVTTAWENIWADALSGTKGTLKVKTAAEASSALLSILVSLVWMPSPVMVHSAASREQPAKVQEVPNPTSFGHIRPVRAAPLLPGHEQC